MKTVRKTTHYFTNVVTEKGKSFTTKITGKDKIYFRKERSKS